MTDWPPLVTNDVTMAAGAPATDQPETALDLVASLLLGKLTDTDNWTIKEYSMLL